MSLEKVPNFLVNFSEAEMGVRDGHSYEFNSFLLDVAERQLLHDQKLVTLTPKAFDVLVYLVEHGGHLVLKDELMEAVWPDSFVDDVNLPRAIHTLRKTLGEDGNGNRFIETVPTKGYRFVATVNEVSEPGAVATGFLNPVAKNATDSGADVLHGEAPTATKPKRQRRIVLVTAAMLSLAFLIFLLSFNFPPPLSVKQIKPSPIRYPANDEAYRYYLLGTALADRWSRDDNAKALENFEKAIELDPNYAPAYAGLANAHSVRAFFGGGGNPTEEYLKAKTAIEKALTLDDSLAEAHSYLGELKVNFEWDFAAAEREHKRAVDLDPSSSPVRRMYALFLSFTARSDEAIAEIKTAIDLDPASILNQRIYGQTLYFAGRYDEAIAQSIRTLDMGADFSAVQDSLIGSYRRKGEDDQAFDWFIRGEVQYEETPEAIQLWRTIYARSGWRGIFERQLADAQEAEKSGKPKYMLLARLNSKLENRDQAFANLEKAFSQRSMPLATLKAQPDFDPLRSDPRFHDLLKRVNLE